MKLGIGRTNYNVMLHERFPHKGGKIFVVTEKGLVFIEGERDPVDAVDPIEEMTRRSYEGIEAVIEIADTLSTEGTVTNFFTSESEHERLIGFLAKFAVFKIADLASYLGLKREYAKALINELIRVGVAVPYWSYYKRAEVWARALDNSYRGVKQTDYRGLTTEQIQKAELQKMINKEEETDRAEIERLQRLKARNILSKEGEEQLAALLNKKGSSTPAKKKKTNEVVSKLVPDVRPRKISKIEAEMMRQPVEPWLDQVEQQRELGAPDEEIEENLTREMKRSKRKGPPGVIDPADISDEEFLASQQDDDLRSMIGKEIEVDFPEKTPKKKNPPTKSRALKPKKK